MGELLCENCYSQLDFLGSEDLRCQLFSDETKVYLDKVQALAVYDQLLQKMLHQYKYQSARDYGRLFGYWLYEYLDLSGVEAVTFIPIHKRRYRERGYNQARLIAQELARRLEVPCVSLLSRPIYKKNQALSRNKAERLAKTQGVFASVACQLPRTAKILLVDDVVTSGATLNEAARVLKTAQFQYVQAVAVAHGE